MRVLLDECFPAPIKGALKGYQVFTVEDEGLKGLSNGALISRAEGKYDIFVTAYKNLRYQQNLSGRRLAIIELPYNSWPKLRSDIAALETAIGKAIPGDYVILPPQHTNIS